MTIYEQRKTDWERSRSEMLAAANDPTRSAAVRTEANRRVAILDGCLRKNAERIAKASATA